MFLSEPPLSFELTAHGVAMKAALDALMRAARSQAPIMLRAEAGAEVHALARLAHDNSPCCDRPFVALACLTIDDLPTGVFGGNVGTLFLDEVGELAAPLQTRLVHELDKASAESRRARVISATKRDLDHDTATRRFREDLFFRLNVMEIRIPPLRESPQDILPLTRALVTSLSVDLGRRPPGLSDAAAAMLLEHHWPANLRELKNVIERALLTWPSDVIEPEAFPELRPADSRRHPRVGDDVTLRDLERAHILRILGRAPSSRSAAAVLGIDEATLWRRRRRYERERDAPGGRDKTPRLPHVGGGEGSK